MEYITSDLMLATTLRYKGFNILRIERDSKDSRKKLFVFESTETIKEIVNNFMNNKIQVEPIVWANTQKTLKNMIYNT